MIIYSLMFFVSLRSLLLFLLFYLLFYLGPLSFLLGEPSQKFVDFVYTFKSTVLGFIDFLLLSLNIYFVYFIFSLIFFSPSADFEFCLFFFF